ncbi:LV321 protein, partial [Atractosteus spatula]|nr:LV321 protein [Atractosteus spatula]
MRRILYIQSAGGTPTYDNDSDKNVFTASKGNSESELMIVAEAAVTLKQERLTLTKQKDKTARIGCKVEGTELKSAYIHWYQRKEGAAFKRILYVHGEGQIQVDPEFSDLGFSADKNSNDNTCSLIIERAQADHSASYYCAYWDSHSDTGAIRSLNKNSVLCALPF